MNSQVFIKMILYEKKVESIYALAFEFKGALLMDHTIKVRNSDITINLFNSNHENNCSIDSLYPKIREITFSNTVMFGEHQQKYLWDEKVKIYCQYSS